MGSNPTAGTNTALLEHHPPRNGLSSTASTTSGEDLETTVGQKLDALTRWLRFHARLAHAIDPCLLALQRHTSLSVITSGTNGANRTIKRSAAAASGCHNSRCSMVSPTAGQRENQFLLIARDRLRAPEKSCFDREMPILGALSAPSSTGGLLGRPRVALLSNSTTVVLITNRDLRDTSRPTRFARRAAGHSHRSGIPATLPGYWDRPPRNSAAPFRLFVLTARPLRSASAIVTRLDCRYHIWSLLPGPAPAHASAHQPSPDPGSLPR